MAAQDPSAGKVVLRRGRPRASAMGGEVEPAVATEVDAAVDLAGRVPAGGARQNAAHVRQQAQRLPGGIVCVHVGVALGSKMVADRREERVAHGQAVPPDRPGIPGVGLRVEVEEVNGRRRAGNRCARIQLRCGRDKRLVRIGSNGPAARQDGRPRQAGRPGGNGEPCQQEARAKSPRFHMLITTFRSAFTFSRATTVPSGSITRTCTVSVCPNPKCSMGGCPLA